MYQTWITGMPAFRHASASRLQFSTAFCSFACAGAPESANAPPSIITSFCMSWMISAARLRSMSTLSFSLMVPSAHERLAAAAHLGLDAVQGRRRRHEQPAPVGAAPVQVADALRNLDDAEMLALGREDPHTFGPGHPDVAALVALHPVHELARLEVAGADA